MMWPRYSMESIWKKTFLTFSKEVMFLEPAKDLGDMLNMDLFVQRENENIIQIDDDKNI